MPKAGLWIWAPLSSGCMTLTKFLNNIWRRRKDISYQRSMSDVEIFCKVFKLCGVFFWLVGFWLFLCFIIYYCYFIFRQHFLKSYIVQLSMSRQSKCSGYKWIWKDWVLKFSTSLDMVNFFMFLTLWSEEDYHLYHILMFVLSRKAHSFVSKLWILMYLYTKCWCFSGEKCFFIIFFFF